MANIINKFLNSMKLNDDDYEDEDDFDLDDDYVEEEQPKFNKRKAAHKPVEDDLDLDFEPEQPAAKEQRPFRAKKTQNNVVPMRSRTSMEVCMVRPASMDDAREVCDTLLSGRAVVINMEGVHVDLAQRIVDFTLGACYSMNGNLQSISKYIFIVTPSNIELSGDFQDNFGSKDSSALNI